MPSPDIFIIWRKNVNSMFIPALATSIGRGRVMRMNAASMSMRLMFHRSAPLIVSPFLFVVLRVRVYTTAGTYIHSSPRHIQLTGGTLSECAAGERKGGTFYFGNVPGLPPTILGKDMCRFFTPSRLFSSFHHYPSLQQARQCVKMPTDSTKNPKYTATDQLFLWTGSRRVD